MDIGEIATASQAFAKRLEAVKASIAPEGWGWYPYGTMANVPALDALLTGANRRLLDLIAGAPVLDIGAADGDLAFFMESLGLEAHVVDWPFTNFNHLRGAKALREALGSKVVIHEADLDSQFRLPHDVTYGLVFFLGILYHLKNPYFALETLARRSRHLLLSTRIARLTPDKKTRLKDYSVAYLLDRDECNNDSTNYWIFSEGGLRRILDRTGWEVRDLLLLGNTTDSDPASREGDERAFCLLRSRVAS